jgi:hypothetical protein
MIASKGWGKVTLAALLAGWLFLGATVPARAGLGGDLGSADSDAIATGGTMLSSPAPESEPAISSSYSVKSFVTGGGVTVREYVASTGAIFGVAWQGRRPPDLSVLLGVYYAEYVSAASLQRHKDLHRAKIVGPGSTVLMSGHMGHVVGRAYAPSLVPSGLDPQAVVK